MQKNELIPPSTTLGRYHSLGHFNKDHKNYVVINWCLGNTCNYKCSYCPKGLHDGSSEWPDYQTIINFCKKTMKHYKNKKLYFEFTGGEVTLWKDLPQVAQFLKSVDCRIGIISNASRSEKFWNQILPDLDHVCLSFHPETGRAEHFFKIAQICSQKIRTHINFMMHPDYFSETLALAYKIKDLENISIAVQPLTKEMGEDLYDYSASQKRVINTQNSFLAKQIKYTKNFESYRGAMEMITDSGEKIKMSPQRFISSSNNSWKGWNCYAGVEQIVIDMKGDIFRGWCKVGGEVGNISQERLSLPTQPILCNKDFCHCNLDIMTTKTKVSLEKIPFWKRAFKKSPSTPSEERIYGD